LILLLTEGQVSDYRGAATVLPALPDADILIADRGYDSDWFREALTDRSIEPCIPGRKNRKLPVDYDTACYKQRAISWNACLAGSKTGAASQCAMTDAHTPS